MQFSDIWEWIKEHPAVSLVVAIGIAALIFIVAKQAQAQAAGTAKTPAGTTPTGNITNIHKKVINRFDHHSGGSGSNKQHKKSAGTHTVSYGQNFHAIAAQYGVSSPDLYAQNQGYLDSMSAAQGDINGPAPWDNITSGMVLDIPAAG